MFCTKESFRIFPTYTEVFKNGQEEIITNLLQEGLAEKYIIFTTSISALLYASHIKGVSALTIARDIDLLRSQNRLMREGDDHGGSWVIL